MFRRLLALAQAQPRKAALVRRAALQYRWLVAGGQRVRRVPVPKVAEAKGSLRNY